MVGSSVEVANLFTIWFGTNCEAGFDFLKYDYIYRVVAVCGGTARLINVEKFLLILSYRAQRTAAAGERKKYLNIKPHASGVLLSGT